MFTKAKKSIFFWHIIRINHSMHQHINRIQKKYKRYSNKMKQGLQNKQAPILRHGLLQALAPKNITLIKMINLILHSTNPAKLVLTLCTNHMIASSLLLRHNNPTFGTIHNLLPIGFQIKNQSLIQLIFTIFPDMIFQSTPHTNLSLTLLTSALERISPCKNRMSLLFELFIQLFRSHGRQ
jgi:hypothetical protein